MLRERVTHDVLGIVLAAFAAISFGTLAIFGKLAYDEGATPVPLLAVRFAFATALLVGFHAVSRRPVFVGRGRVVRLLLLGGLGYAFEAGLFFAALENAPAQVVGLIFYSYPVWTNLLGFATGLERFSGRLVGALALGTAGVVSIFSITDIGVKGPLLALAAALAVAVYFILAQVLMRGVNPWAAATWTTGGAAMSLLTLTAASGTWLPAGAIVWALALGVSSAISFVLMYAAIGLIGSARTAIANMLEPVTTVILAAIVLGEVLTRRVALGAVLIVTALPVLVTTGRKPDDVPAPCDTA